MQVNSLRSKENLFSQAFKKFKGQKNFFNYVAGKKGDFALEEVAVGFNEEKEN